MNNLKINDFFKCGNIVLPLYFFKNYKSYNLKLEEFIFLMYLYNLGNNFIFDPNKFCSDLNMDLTEVMTLVGILSDKNFIKVDVKKNEKGMMEEVVCLDGFYSKISMKVINEMTEENNKNIEDSDVFELIQKEFGRTLSPMEIEIIKAWLENNNYSEEIIKEAIKEAVFNGVSNLRYIDKILYEWGKNGIKSAKDVENNRKKRNEKKNIEKESNSDIDLDIVEWNWFDDDE